MATLNVAATRLLKGCILGVPQSTILMTLRVIAPHRQGVDMARRVFASQLPQWISAKCDAQLPITHEVVNLFAELVVGLQLEAGIAVSQRFHVRRAPNHTQGQRDELLELALPLMLDSAAELSGQWALAALNDVLSGSRSFARPSVDSILQRLPTVPGSGINRFFILRAADKLQIPFYTAASGQVVLGTGSKSRWLQSLTSDRTSSIGVRLAKDKQLTAHVLRQVGLPGATHAVARDETHAIEIANAMGYPVVVKPADADRGQGVAADLRTAADVSEAFGAALSISKKILVEKWFPGFTHRLTVQDDRVIRVVKRVAGGVVGDGKNSVSRLVELFQKTPQQQRMARQLGRSPLALDAEATALLKQEGKTADYVPKLDEYIKLRRRDNINAGGTNIELPFTDTTSVHPDNIRLAVNATDALRLDFAGVDLIISDISQSWLDIGALICEVNAVPQLGGWKDEALYQGVLTRLFQGEACVPAELRLHGANKQRRDALRESIEMTQTDACVSTADGIWIEGQLVGTGFRDSFDAARALLQRRDAKRIVCMMSVHDVFSNGLPLSHWHSIVLDEAQHFSQAEKDELATVSQWPLLKSI